MSGRDDESDTKRALESSAAADLTQSGPFQRRRTAAAILILTKTWLLAIGHDSWGAQRALAHTNARRRFADLRIRIIEISMLPTPKFEIRNPSPTTFQPPAPVASNCSETSRSMAVCDALLSRTLCFGLRGVLSAAPTLPQRCNFAHDLPVTAQGLPRRYSSSRNRNHDPGRQPGTPVAHQAQRGSWREVDRSLLVGVRDKSGFIWSPAGADVWPPGVHRNPIPLWKPSKLSHQTHSGAHTSDGGGRHGRHSPCFRSRLHKVEREEASVAAENQPWTKRLAPRTLRVANRHRLRGISSIIANFASDDGGADSESISKPISSYMSIRCDCGRSHQCEAFAFPQMPGLPEIRCENTPQLVFDCSDERLSLRFVMPYWWSGYRKGRVIVAGDVSRIRFRGARGMRGRVLALVSVLGP
ncbi:hypothetical protein B0J14DRAFT_563714 [Halenospora varia]|nr:hypothetical protein B0J14DRAFT_563714 [Halenospora varia]